MLKAVKFVGFIEPDRATSKCFHVTATDGRDWVVRARKLGYNAKRLFNEYLAGMIACEFGLARPKVQLIRIPYKIFKELDENDFDNSCSIGAATEYVEGLELIPKPPNSTNIDWTSPAFRVKNRTHLESILGPDYSFDQFYAQRVFADWILLEDDWKYENLHITPENTPIFLDLDFAFNGGGWKDLPHVYDWIHMFSPQAPYCEGIIKELSLFEPWFNKLRSLRKEMFQQAIDTLPMEWEIPTNYLDTLMNLLFGDINHFLEQFEYAFEIKIEMNEFLD